MSSGDLKSIDRTLTALDSTRKRVHATELYTLAMLPRLRRRAEQARAFSEHVRASLLNVADTVELQQQMSGTTGEGRLLCLVITSSRGMCGPYNRRVLDEVESFAAAHGGLAADDLEFVVLGAKGRTALRTAGARVALGVEKGLEDISLEEMSSLTRWVLARTRSGVYREVVCFATEYLDPLHTRASAMPLLPLTSQTGTAAPGGQQSILDFDGEAGALIDRLTEDCTVGLMYSLLRYSVAAEYTERRLAMQQASRGIDEEILATRGRRKAALSQKETAQLLEIVTNQRPGGNRRRRHV